MSAAKHSSEPGVALVLGATGGIGGHLARKLNDRGWCIRALHRDARRNSQLLPEYQWIQGDALRIDDVLRAALGCELIVHAVNPPGYREWSELVLPMMDNTIAAAKHEGARIVLPGTVYNFGPDVFPEPNEESPQQPVTAKGKIRVELERRLEKASGQGAKALIVRAGDFFGPLAGNNWFSQGLIKPGIAVKKIVSPNAQGVGHQWAYLPDVAETMARLIERRHKLPTFARYHMEGVWDPDNSRMADAIEKAVGYKVARKRFPWWLLRLGSPISPLFREILEMQYLWKIPLRMNNSKLVSEIGEEPMTPLIEAVKATLIAQSSMPRCD
ncbi:NAD-dependent epimerase/dehydratase family protein [Neorhizobium sp. NPDC001467]|uniref:NAD-dependent epimerase/dehydratase family protein n=1 Tax=Neorhizobium sp. NPDC001467 TaxID=3390595 RepID=UPI003D08B290